MSMFGPLFVVKGSSWLAFLRSKALELEVVATYGVKMAEKASSTLLPWGSSM